MCKKNIYVICLIAALSVIVPCNQSFARRTRLEDKPEQNISLEVQGDKVVLVADGKEIAVGSLDKPGFILGQTLSRWAYSKGVLNLEIDFGRVKYTAKNFYDYVKQYFSMLGYDNISNTERRFLIRMYKRGKPYAAGMEEIEGKIEKWCEKRNIPLPNGWEENKAKLKKEDRIDYLVAQVKNWFAVAWNEGHPSIEYRFNFDDKPEIGDNFWELPIWPVTEEGELNADLVKWMFDENEEPSEGYLESDKVSLKELIGFPPEQLRLPLR